MSQNVQNVSTGVASAGGTVAVNPTRQAWWLLYLGFIVAPTLAGLDKFAGFMTDWTQYLAPSVSGLLGGHDQTLFT